MIGWRRYLYRIDLGVWTYPSFRKLWLGTTISLLGSQFSGLAIPLLAVLTLGASPFEMGLLTVARYVPFLLVGLFAGVWVDRRTRRPILIASDVGRALLLATIPLAALRGTPTALHLYVVVFLVGICTVFFDVAYRAYLPSLVPPERLAEANTKLQVGSSTVALVGPGLAGLVVQLFSAPFAIGLDALSFVASAGVVGLIGEREAPPEKTPPAPIFAEIRAGFTVIVGNRLLQAVILNNIAINFLTAGIQALYVLYATRELAVSPAALGIVFAAGNAGALLAVLLVGHLNTRLGFGRATTAAAVLLGLCYIPVIVASRATAVPLLILGQLLFTVSSLTYDVNTTSLGQAIVPQHLLGRFVATAHFLVLGTPIFGGLVAGVAGQLLGSRLTIGIAALGILVASELMLRSPLPKLDRLTGENVIGPTN